MLEVTEVAAIDEPRCIGCKICDLVCPTLAISMVNRIAKVKADDCFACGNCVSRCPVKCISMQPRKQPITFATSLEDADRGKIRKLCLDAKLNPEQVICFCTATRAEEVAAAILKGAKDPVEIARRTGIRGGCTIECITPIFRLMKAAGLELEKAPGWQWYTQPPSIWEIPEEIRMKYSTRGFYFEEDVKLMEKVMKASPSEA